VSVALTAGVLAVAAAPAVAAPPTRTEASQHVVVADPAACGSYGVEWDNAPPTFCEILR